MRHQFVGEAADSALGRFKGLLGGSKGSSSSATQQPPPGSNQLALDLMHDYERSGLGWFWASDREGRLSYISPHVSERLNLSSADLLGRPFHSLFILEREDDDTLERQLEARRGFAVAGQPVESQRVLAGPDRIARRQLPATVGTGTPFGHHVVVDIDAHDHARRRLPGDGDVATIVVVERRHHEIAGSRHTG